jgi:hypothetical protein
MLVLDDITLTAPKSIFILYLLISGNFLANLLGCRTQEAFNNNMVLKHLLGFMTMYFFIVLVDTKSKWSDSPHTQLLFTLLFYFLFIITTRMDYDWWIIFIIGLSIVYILQVYKDHDKTTQEQREQLQKYQKYLTYTVFIIIIIGFLIYYGNKKAEYGKNFNILSFFLGKSKCSFDTNQIKLNDYQAFINAFKNI